jgi:hypothetical protein
MVIEPVPGWTYAQAEKLTVSQVGEEQACLAVTGHDVPDPKKIDAVYPAQLEALARELKISLGKIKVKWKQPDKMPNGKVPLSRWVVEGVTRNQKDGNLLIVATQPDGGKAVFGLAFVPAGNDADAQKVLTAFTTLGPP